MGKLSVDDLENDEKESGKNNEEISALKETVNSWGGKLSSLEESIKSLVDSSAAKNNEEQSAKEAAAAAAKLNNVNADIQASLKELEKQGFDADKIDIITSAVNTALKKKGSTGLDELDALKKQLNEVTEKLNKSESKLNETDFDKSLSALVNDPVLNNFNNYELPLAYWWQIAVEEPMAEGKLDAKTIARYKNNPELIEADFHKFIKKVKSDPALLKEAENVKDTMRQKMKERKLSASIPGNSFGLLSNPAEKEESGNSKDLGGMLDFGVSKLLKDRMGKK